MEFGWSEDEQSFRAEVRAFLKEHWDPKPLHDFGTDDHKAREYVRAFKMTLAEHGWLTMAWPTEYGGQGASFVRQMIFKEESAIQKAPTSGGAEDILAPALMIHGTDEQRREYLTPIARGEVLWSQGYSEPGAGSDLASLQTRAVRDGDEYVVNGQKVWTSHAHYADWIMLLSRTNPEAPKHRGITFLLVDLRSPGVTINPLINMAWGHEFNEEFFEDVRVPADQMVGEENRGWYVAMTLLDNERSNITGAMSVQRKIDRLLAYLGSEEGARRSRLSRHDALRQQIAQRAVEAAVLFNLSLRIITMQRQGMVPNYEASASKIVGYEAEQGLNIAATKAFGLYANLWDPEDPAATMEAGFTHGYIERAASIGGGTLEIQRNVIATRGLGLPRG